LDVAGLPVSTRIILRWGLIVSSAGIRFRWKK